MPMPAPAILYDLLHLLNPDLIYHLQTRFDDDFADYVRIAIDAMETAQPTNELEDYLRLPVENVKDPLKWWYENRRAYPNLSRMARDYLSIPGLSVYHLFIHICD
jgi:hypothetical protein